MERPISMLTNVGIPMPKLLICEDGDRGCMQCNDCPCAVPHYEDVCRKARCMGCECRLIDEEARLEAEEEWREYNPWSFMTDSEFLAQIGIPGKTMLKDMYLNKFYTNKPLPYLPDKPIKFRRYGNYGKGPEYNHMQDALMYGTGVSHVYFDEETKEVTGKNPDGTTYPVALGQKQILSKEET